MDWFFGTPEQQQAAMAGAKMAQSQFSQDQQAKVLGRLAPYAQQQDWAGLEKQIQYIDQHPEVKTVETQKIMEPFRQMILENKVAPTLQRSLRAPGDVALGTEPASVPPQEAPYAGRVLEQQYRPASGLEAMRALSEARIQNPGIDPLFKTLLGAATDQAKLESHLQGLELSRRAAQPFRIVKDDMTGQMLAINQETGAITSIQSPEQAQALAQLMERAKKIGGTLPELKGEGIVPGSWDPTTGTFRPIPEAAKPGGVLSDLKDYQWGILAYSGRLPDGSKGTPEQIKMAKDYVGGKEGSAIRVAGATETARNESKLNEFIEKPQLWRDKATGQSAPSNLTNRQVRGSGQYVEVTDRTGQFLDAAPQVKEIIRQIRSVIPRVYPTDNPLVNAKHMGQLRLQADPAISLIDTLLYVDGPMIAKAGGDSQNIAAVETERIHKSLGASFWQSKSGALKALDAIDNIINKGVSHALQHTPEQAKRWAGQGANKFSGFESVGRPPTVPGVRP